MTKVTILGQSQGDKAKCTCRVCSKQFKPWETEYECDQCDEYGEVEVWRDWSFGEPDCVPCPICNGKKSGTRLERQFCSEDCRDEYFYPNSMDI